MTIYFCEDNLTMFHEEENCRVEIENAFLEQQLADFLSEHEEEVRNLILCLVYDGTVKRINHEELCDDYEQDIEEYISTHMIEVEVEEKDIEAYEMRYDWGD